MSLATLVFEIALTRIFSVTMWYHFAFMVISMALLGFGGSGIFLMLFPQILNRDIRRMSVLFAVLLSVSIVGSIVIISHIALDPFQMIQVPSQWFLLFAVYGVLTVPFFLSGLSTVFLLSKMSEWVSGLYFASLIGSAVGCFLVIGLIPVFSNVGAVMASAFFVLIAALCFNHAGSFRSCIWIAGLIILMCPLVLYSKNLFSFKIAQSKGMADELYKKGLKPVLSRWNTFSQLDVFNATDGAYAPGLSRKYSSELFPEQVWIYIDADAIATIMALKKDDPALNFYEYLPTSLVYKLRPEAKVCIIGAGGGFDVLAALKIGQIQNITAVEINSDTSRIVREHFGDFSGHLFDLPNVKLINMEGRSFLHSSKERFDIMQLTLVDTWAAASLGAYSLTENYLYTQEAFLQYLNHLNDNGILVVTRWLTFPPKESLKVAGIAFSALEEMKIPHPESNMVLIGSENVAVLFIKKTEFQSSEVAQIRQLCEQLGFSILYAPGLQQDNIFSQFFQQNDKEMFYYAYPFDINPSTDDRPFYFQYNTWKNIFNLRRNGLSQLDRDNIGYLVLLSTLFQAVVLTLILIFWPMKLIQKRQGKSATPIVGACLLYFGCLGMGFMLIEVILIQKFILLLGHPVYSLSIVLSSLLGFAGLGSLSTAKIHQDISEQLKRIIGVLVGVLFVYIFLLSKILYVFLPWSLPARFGVALVLLAPLGFLLGMPFPLGVKFINRIEAKLIPGGWGVNGCFSVMASIVSVIMAMNFGFMAVLELAAVCYLVAILAIDSIGRKVRDVKG